MTARGARRRDALIVLGVGAITVGCFTDPINRAPTVSSISSESGTVMRGKDATFTAVASDPDSDTLTLSWFQKSGPCLDLSQPPTPTDFGQRFSVTGDKTGGSFCVWAFATDRYGAVGLNNRSFYPDTLPPVAKIRLLSPQVATLYPLYTPFVLSNDSTDPDGDPLTSEWTLDVQPPGSTKQLLATGCPNDPAGKDVHCFQADVTGHYQVVLTVKTADGPSSMDMMAFDVDKDRLPCIDVPTCVPKLDGTPVLDPTKDQSFTVSMVNDDGDPSSAAQYKWFFTVNDALLPFEHNYAMLPIPANQYHEGDLTKIRVQVYDRNRQAGEAALDKCGDADVCAGDPQRPACFQRVTWTVSWL